MFQNQRYVTRGVVEALSLHVQFSLWSLIDTMEGEKDYLQIFERFPSAAGQRIIHRQEQPTYRREYLMKTAASKGQQIKIFVIDDTAHSTMLLADEY